MKIWHEELPYEAASMTSDRIFTEQSLFFDIETTGFSSAHTQVYLIGCASRRKDKLILDQFFAEQPSEESGVLSAFLQFIKDFDTFITFNGMGFDIPYLQGRYAYHLLPDPFDGYKNLDLYKEAVRLKSLLKLPNYKQKTIESFLGIGREDAFNGGELINVYHSYVRHPNAEACRLLKLHNYEDVIDMPKLLPLLSYQALLNGCFTVSSIEAMEHDTQREILLTLHLPEPLPQKISCSREEFSLTAEEETVFLTIRLLEDELKLFFSDYKNYYYLPDEDVAVPKDICTSVDKSHRKNATATTCYRRKYALFLPQYEELFSPAFRTQRKDKKSYFELSEEFISSEELRKNYAAHLLDILSGQH